MSIGAYSEVCSQHANMVSNYQNNVNLLMSGNSFIKGGKVDNSKWKRLVKLCTVGFRFAQPNLQLFCFTQIWGFAGNCVPRQSLGTGQTSLTITQTGFIHQPTIEGSSM